MRKRVLITGAAGKIGSYLAKQMADGYDLVLTDVRQPEETYGLNFYKIDICDFNSFQEACYLMDVVIHLAANPNQNDPWEKLYSPNIIGTYNVFQSAVNTGCKRVVFASSIHTVNGYPAEIQVQTHMPVRPSNIYGATKVWGEALARFFSDQNGISMICLRIGDVRHPNQSEIRQDNPNLYAIITFEDLLRLFIAAIEANADLRFGIFHGLSNNRMKRLDIKDTCEQLGYNPIHNAFDIAEEK